MRALELMVDIDEVIFPLGDSIHDLAHKAGLHDGTQPWSNWSAWLQYGCEPDPYWDLWTDFAMAGGYLKTPPIEGRVEALRWAMWEGHKIHLVTARGFMNHADAIRDWTPKWLEEFGVPYHTLTYSQNKGQAMAELGVVFDSAVDDSPKNFGHLADAGVDVYLQEHPHNASADIPAERRVPDLWEWLYRLEKTFQ